MMFAKTKRSSQFKLRRLILFNDKTKSSTSARLNNTIAAKHVFILT